MSSQEADPEAVGGEDEQPAVEPEEGGEVEGGETPPEKPMVDLPSGEAFDYAEASAALKVSPGKVVLVAGENDAGKTSLLCALYECFLRGEFAGQQFAGSQTLRAFDQRCFLQRVESGRDRPDMERTPLPAGELALLHLELEGKSSGERVAVLATDLAGEAFRLIRDNPEECDRYPILSHLDCITVLLDAERLRKPEQRHGHIGTTRTMLRSLLQSQTVPEGVPILLAISKWDVLPGKVEEELAIADAGEILAVAGENPTELMKIAAAPAQGTALPANYGLETLLRKWLTALPPPDHFAVGIESDAATPKSPFDTFGGPE